jgi:hypothetical protein
MFYILNRIKNFTGKKMNVKLWTLSVLHIRICIANPDMVEFGPFCLDQSGSETGSHAMEIGYRYWYWLLL